MRCSSCARMAPTYGVSPGICQPCPTPPGPPTGSASRSMPDQPTASDIYLINLDGSGLTKITSDAGANFYPTWSPDGSRLAFSSNRDGDWDIYVMNADGSRVRQLVDSPGLDDKPQWSPDGSRIGFATTRSGSPELSGGRSGDRRGGDALSAADQRPESGLVMGRVAGRVQCCDVERVRYRCHVP